MKEVVGILIFVSIAVLAFYLFLTKKVSSAALMGLLFVGMVCGFVAANYDVIRRLKFKEVELETFERRITEVKAEAIEELREESKTQKASIGLLLRDADDTRKNLESQKKSLEALLHEGKDLKSRVDEQSKAASRIDATLQTATVTLDELKAYTEFNNTVIAAQNKDRKAYDLLKVWSRDQNHRFCIQAGQAYQSIMDAHDSPMRSGGFTVPWNQDVDPEKLSLDKFRMAISTAPQPTYRIGIMEKVMERGFSKREKADFLADVLRRDPHLMVVEHAGFHLSTLTDSKLKSLAIDEQLRIYEEKKDYLK